MDYNQDYEKVPELDIFRSFLKEEGTNPSRLTGELVQASEDTIQGFSSCSTSWTAV